MTMFIVLGLFVSTTVAVENHSRQPVELTERQIPAHYAATPRSSIAAGGSDRIASTDGKIIMPNAEVAREAVSLRYLDARGNGCLFSTRIVQYTPAWSKLKPQAVPINGGKCKARTGRTIGDFVYVIR
jgi:hypothetical protein